ncbi:hypothetical protein K492DRAFT_235095, partial [Lichtheimia hyalospora FSU 10163]
MSHSSSEDFEKVDSSSHSPTEESNDKDQWQSKTENKHNDTDLLTERMSKAAANAPKNKHEFYLTSHAVFVKVERLRKQLRSKRLVPSTYQLTENEKSTLAGYAKDYTTLAYAYLDHVTNANNDAEESVHVQNLARLLDLTERVCFSQESGDSMVSGLRDWLNFNWPLDVSDTCVTDTVQRDSDDDELVIVDHSDISNKSEEYMEERKNNHWNSIQRLLLRGSIKQAIYLLELQMPKCTSSMQGHLVRFINLLKAMPCLATHVTTRQETTWLEWISKREMEYEEFKRLKTEDSDQINTLYNIIQGDKHTIAQSGTLLESFIGVMIYCDPFQDAKQLGDLANLVHAHVDCDSVTAASFYILTHNWDQALISYDDYWLQTHLGHLLITGGFLDHGDDTQGTILAEMDQESCTGPVQSITYVFAQMISKEYDMWSEAIDYIESCDVNREYWSANILDSRTMSSDIPHLKEMLEYCQNRDLSRSRRILDLKIAKKYDERGNQSNAILHYALAKDIAALDQVAKRILEKYLNKGILDPFSRADGSLKSTMMQSKYYAFLIQYTDLKDLLNDKKYSDAALLSKQLLQSPDIPNGYEMRLLLDLLPVLEASNDVVIFDVKDSLNLIRLLQHISYQDPTSSARLKQCLSMNLANALLASSS